MNLIDAVILGYALGGLIIGSCYLTVFFIYILPQYIKDQWGLYQSRKNCIPDTRKTEIISYEEAIKRGLVRE